MAYSQDKLQKLRENLINIINFEFEFLQVNADGETSIVLTKKESELNIEAILTEKLIRIRKLKEPTL